MRFPLAPLLELTSLSSDQARRCVRASGSKWTRAKEQGISEHTADLWAVALGFLPWEVWPEWLTDPSRPCAAPDCPVTFIPPLTATGQKERHYCSRTCQIRTNARRRYQQDEAARERRKLASRRYKAQKRDAA